MAKTGGPKYAEADATVPIIGPWASIESGYSPRRCRRPGTARKCRLLPAAADETGTARVPRRKRRRLSGARRTTAFAPGGKGWARRRGAPADDPRPPPRRIPIPGEKTRRVSEGVPLWGGEGLPTWHRGVPHAHRPGGVRPSASRSVPRPATPVPRRSARRPPASPAPRPRALAPPPAGPPSPSENRRSLGYWVTSRVLEQSRSVSLARTFDLGHESIVEQRA